MDEQTDTEREQVYLTECQWSTSELSRFDVNIIFRDASETKPHILNLTL